MNRIFIILFALLLTSGVKAQIKQPCSTCLPEGITFTTQAQIDSFQVNYPNCTEIEGNVTICGDSSISNLNGLNILTHIDGKLKIYNNQILNSLTGLDNLSTVAGTVDIGFHIDDTDYGNPLLTNLTGLNNLTSVDGSLWIRYNNALINLIGLDALDSIGNSLYIGHNASLSNLMGLNSLSKIGSNVQFYHNENLTDLTGLSALFYIGGFLYINVNPSLISLNGLDALTISVGGIAIDENNALTSLSGLDSLEIAGFISITYNESLTSLAGIENINADSISGLSINNNISLSTCDVQSICDLLSNPSCTITIYGNDFGCDNASQIASACGISFTCLPYGDYYFISQTDIDSFQLYYPSCSDLTGDIYIMGGDSISNLYGLNNVTSIVGDLYIYNNDSLTSLVGLDSLSYFSGNLNIWGNDALTSMIGLDNLTTIEGSINIGDDWFGGNLGLTSLNGLNSLEIARYINIYKNASLLSLTGIDNVDENSIESVSIYHNNSLSTCEVESICNYVVSYGSNIYVNDNAVGCNSSDEIIVACGLSIDETATPEPQITIHPNPATAAITITLPTTTSVNSLILSVYNVNAQRVISHRITEPQIVVDISTLPSGVYFARVTTDRTVMVSKFIKK